MKRLIAGLLFSAVVVGAMPAMAVEGDTENHCVRNLASRVQTVNGVQYVIPANALGYIKQLPATAGYFIIEWNRVYQYAGTMREDVFNVRALTAHTQFAECD